MVLTELGTKLTAALKKMQSVTVVSEEVLDRMLGEMARALLEADVNVKIVGEVRKAIKEKANLEGAGTNRRKAIQRAVIKELTRVLDPEAKPYDMKKGKSNVLMFVGLQGAGKTTTIAKYAHYYKLRGWKCCMVCADTFRAGAYDQLRQNATKLRCPFFGSYTDADPVKIASEGVSHFRRENYELIIVDTSGRHSQESALFDEMQEISAAIDPDMVVFVLDATQGQSIGDQAKSFHEAVDIGSVVVTKLDGHARGGGALSAVAATGAPIVFIGSGEHFDDFEPFSPASFVSRLLGMGDMRGLVAQIKDTVGDDKSPELMDRFAKGAFTFSDMYEQFENVMKLGPLNKVMAMIPGMPQMLGGDELCVDDDQGSNRLKRFMYMMDSMTDEELDGHVDLERAPSRIDRIARGSGTHPLDVGQLLNCHRQFEKVVAKMGKSGLMKGGDAHMAKQMQRNPNNVMQQLHKAMDPRMLQQMGGAQNVMNMMKEMSKLDAAGVA
mmetsp:Transcript_26547/g.81610  ORF Transcript_26547/g.81610 Transcript_26547/m.81610 type:complete len:496 (-) Transcript_26547:737-2224(-)|eukprot:CAMPEP_0198648612 /NCGR_PEP_ID=MMETSP1467-20131203/3623_1 /TAXON_ID=1462469 /ORGANISM="unid. sp., Strain CCMP2135" /LENGTH=495 /DNA_ID=CAMNT_0044384345 /DNA_START=283 /DNA_END=1770 /DNA_ORIENTATION=+